MTAMRVGPQEAGSEWCQARKISFIMLSLNAGFADQNIVTEKLVIDVDGTFLPARFDALYL
jgi:hypothetical protein